MWMRVYNDARGVPMYALGGSFTHFECTHTALSHILFNQILLYIKFTPMSSLYILHTSLLYNIVYTRNTYLMYASCIHNIC